MANLWGMWITFAAAVLGNALPVLEAQETAMQLPAVTVKTDVPLIKIAELSMVEPRFGPAAVAHEGYIYIVGGLNAEDTPSRTIERFDVKTGRSEIFAHLKFPRFWHGALIHAGRLYVIGGAMLSVEDLPSNPQDAEEALKTAKRKGVDKRQRTYFTSPGFASPPWIPIPFVEVVDLRTGEVQHGPPLLRPVYSFGCAAVSDQMAVIGGRVGEAPISATANWAQPSAAPPPSRPPPRITTPTDRLSIYDPVKGGWTLGPSLPRAKQTTVVLNGPYIIAAGGYIDAGGLTDVDVFDLRTGTWRAATPLVRAASAHSMVMLDHYLFLFGDYIYPDELLIYDLRTETSEVFTLGYKAARHTAAVTHERKIYVMGGRALRITAPLKTIQIFALRKDVKPAKSQQGSLDGAMPSTGR